MDWLESLNTVLTPFLIGLLVSAGVGLIIGLEREFNTHDKPSHIGGIRTFILVSLLGYTAGWMGQSGFPEIRILVMAGFFLLVAISYFSQATKGNPGLTTEVALILTLLLGVFISAGQMRASLAIVVVMTVVLSLKEQLHGFIQRITEEELFAFIKFIVLALLVLPMLPDQSFGPENLLNLRDMGWIVILVLSISFAGYLLLKFGSPNKGILLTAGVGGLFSSTLIAWVFSARSRERKDLSQAFGAGIVLASSIMVVRVFVLTTLFAYPVAILLLAFMMFASRQWLGTTLTYLSGAVAGMADIDAITISTAKWAAVTPDQHRQAAVIILLAVMSNSLFKLLVSLFNGARELRQSVLTGFGLVLLVGIIFTVVYLLNIV
jgi:uncharacterized membrane protein (DUF4010 family)